MPAQMKQQIADAFLHMSRKKSVDTITVKDLVTECGITRQTFYYHFQDIIEVIEWSFRQKMEEILRESLKCDTLEQAMTLLIRSINDSPDILERLMNSRKREQTEQILFRVCHAYLEQLSGGKGITREAKKSDVDCALDFYSFAIAGMILELRKKRNMDIDAYAKQLTRLVLTGISVE